MKSAVLTRGGSNRPDSASGELAWRGWTVRGSRGEAIGKIEEIYVADETAAPDWALVRGDGPGASASFLPLRGSRSEGNEVIVPFTRAQVTHAPHTEQGSRLPSEQGAALYDYYGISKADRSPSEARPAGAWEMVVAAEQKLTVQLAHAWQQWLSDLRGRSEAARSATATASRQRRLAAKPRKENDMKTTSNDKTIRDAVIRELEWDPRVHTDHIGVSASDGALVLSGHVPSYSDRWAAVRAAERVYGVRAVADEIEIKLGQSSVRNDEDIAEDVARHMHVNTAIPAGVKADVIKGHVTLRGDCQWGYERDEAQRAIRYIAGVHNISNAITVKPEVLKPADVDHRVGEAIERMADLDARSIQVTASNGTVHLHGVVHSFAERRAAGFAAAAAPGVTDVENEILVTP